MPSARFAMGQQGGELGRMRYLRGAMVVGLLGCTLGLGAGAPAGAGSAAVADGGEELVVSGAFSATGTFESTAECPSFHTIHNGEGSWTGLGDVTFDLDYCVDLMAQDPSPLSGTITVTAAGGTVEGTVVGAVDSVGGPEGYAADYAVTVTGGTGDYADATGALDLAGVWDDPEIPVYSMHGTVAGTVVLPAVELPHPTSFADCIDGNWRNFFDDEGQPFHGTLHCIFYVLWTHMP
jgi:hypothetical protein